MGVPKAGMEFMMSLVSKYLRYYAGYADKISGELYPAEDGVYEIVTYEPLGVCASLASFNATFLYVALKLGPVLAAGNTCIFKASEKAPFGALALGRSVYEAGFPPGVINFVLGAVETGKLLASYMYIACINFTGSVNAGRKV
ncbi:Aldehyde dehydrogenase, N-terminal [Penicillium expansum]|uniref:aldehyde dehydrogenase (NAD(+)) n=1 Tax=Penicillium expansum TaxID=27334 RepID=A0A0A2JF25_PENEN|nr:Aldehyde dehydrogenase, N-terminal [Penicillium expansum]KGO46767.1 Aldehyde dehydrogenase, N-terminal [Penicillium expansum]KGO53381.1 Aldehyde dehydrogenase, N-terminal [Penicillium expansum]KGO72275.1 Aldehyde dehydrogenase, N-terminal [Penicillium expansum]